MHKYKLTRKMMIDGALCGRELSVTCSCVVEELRRLGHDVLTAFEDGRANQSISDRDLLVRATEIGRPLLTLNRLDFKRLHLQMTDHAGIIICTEDPDRVGQAQRVAASIADVGKLPGHLVRVYRPS